MTSRNHSRSCGPGSPGLAAFWLWELPQGWLKGRGRALLLIPGPLGGGAAVEHAAGARRLLGILTGSWCPVTGFFCAGMDLLQTNP